MNIKKVAGFIFIVFSSYRCSSALDNKSLEERNNNNLEEIEPSNL